MSVGEIYRKGGKIYARKATAEEAVQRPYSPLAPVRSDPAWAQGKLQNPEQFYSIIEAADLASQQGINFFVAQPDADEILGNYRKPYIEVPARITGLKLDCMPEQWEEDRGMAGVDMYIDNINRVLSGTMSLLVNKYPIYDFKVDDIGSIPEINLYDDAASAFVVGGLHAPAFTVFKDLVEGRKIETKGIDNIYCHLELMNALDAASGVKTPGLPADFALKTTLLVRPDRRLPGQSITVNPYIPGGQIYPAGEGTSRGSQPRTTLINPDTGEEYTLDGDVGQSGVGYKYAAKTPTPFYSILTYNDIFTTYDGRTIQFFDLRPDANRLFGNYDDEKMHRRMSIQGVKLGFYPYINNAAKAAGAPIGAFNYTINALKHATFEVVVNKNPVFTYKGAELMGEVVTRPVKVGAAATQYYTVKKMERYLVFKDMIEAKKLDVSEDDDVWVRCRLPFTLDSKIVPSTFMVKMTMLTAAQPKPLRM